MTNLTRHSKMYNPFFIDSDGAEVRDIIFYDARGVICKTGRGWLGSNNAIDVLNVGDAIKKRKIDLSLERSFFVPVTGPHYKNGRFCDLYLYVDGVNIRVEAPTVRASRSKAETMFFNCWVVNVFRTSATVETYDRTERTELGKAADALAEQFAGLGLSSWGRYEAERLLEHFDVRPREGVTHD